MTAQARSRKEGAGAGSSVTRTVACLYRHPGTHTHAHSHTCTYRAYTHTHAHTALAVIHLCFHGHTQLLSSVRLRDLSRVQNLTLIKIPMRDNLGRAYGTGRRKTASARVWIKPGDGKFTVNGQSLVQYFPQMSHRTHILEPFLATHSIGAFDVWLTVSGGGLSGQWLHSPLH